MKQIGITANVTQEMKDVIFAEGHKGIAVSDNVGTKVQVDGFALFEKRKDAGDRDDGFALKFWDVEGNDWYTSSSVFIKSFMRMAQAAVDIETNMFVEPMTITICSKKAQKSGNSYYDIEEAPQKETDQSWKSIDW